MIYSRLHWLSAALAGICLTLLANGSQAATTNDSQSASTASASTANSNHSPEQLPARIAKLIEQLGSDQYLVRQAAQDELCHIGPDAYDSLIAAEGSDDVEVASRAQYLLQLIRIQWSQGNDGPEVRQILRNYDEQPEVGRLQKMQELALLPGSQGVGPLCRLVRFEQLPRLSKLAALLVIGQPNPKASLWPARSKNIETILADCSRPGAKWLRAYIEFQRDPAAAAETWCKLVAEELASPDTSKDDVLQSPISEVQRRLADTLVRQFHRDGFPSDELSRTIMRKAIAKTPGDQNSLRQLVDWFVAREAWDLIVETASQFEPTFNSDPILLESLAQARRSQGKTEVADGLSAKAAKLIQGGAEEHWKRAKQFGECGLLTAAEREYRLAIASAPPETETAIRAQTNLAELFHDQQRDLEAAKVGQALVDSADQNEAVQKAITDLDMQLNPRARLNYYYACHYQVQKQLPLAQKHLDEGIKQDPFDADVLIALYDTSADDTARRASALELIRVADDKFRRDIAQTAGNEAPYNEDAWLIGNTEGDYDLAVQYSRRSIELFNRSRDLWLQTSVFSSDDMERAEAGLVDTLAHCYAGKKDFESAVKQQTLAAEKDPHSLAIRRALAQFQAKLEKSERDK